MDAKTTKEFFRIPKKLAKDTSYQGMKLKKFLFGTGNTIFQTEAAIEKDVKKGAKAASKTLGF